MEKYHLYSLENQRVILQLQYHPNTPADKSLMLLPQIRIFFAINGEGTLRVGNQLFPVKDGSLFFLPGYCPYQLVQVDPLNPITSLQLTFDLREFINNDFIVMHKQQLQDFLKSTEECAPLIPEESVYAAKIKNMLFDIRDALSEQNEMSNCVVRASIVLLITYLMKHYSDEGVHARSDTLPLRDMILSTMEYINQHLECELTLELLAEKAHMNRTYYSTVFKKITGMTVWEYILKTRVETAISYLLESNNDNLNDIAQKCGFHNVSYFHKIFKRLTGKTPSEYRSSPQNSCFSQSAPADD